MSALSFMAGERYVVKLPCVRLIIVGGMSSLQGSWTCLYSYFAGERYVVKLPCVRLIIVGGMLSEVFRGHGHVYTDSYFAGERGEAAVCTLNYCW
jgi:hypothetical protein